jgi:AcrR family transcriptional regulator
MLAPPDLVIDHSLCNSCVIGTIRYLQHILWYYSVPMSRANENADSTAVRDRILTAAFEAFQERGYAATSTLEIATRARVSKRELYALVGNKQKMLIAAIGERAKRLQAPADMPILRDRATLAQVLAAFGAQLVREVSDPGVVAVFRLAIAEAIQAPEVARTLDSIGRETSRAALRHIMSESRAAGLIDGRPSDLAAQFVGLLWRDLMISLLLGVAERPNPRAIEARARDAAEAFLRLHPMP